MSEFDRLRNQASIYKEQYPPGTRILLISMGPDIHRINDNTRATVDHVDDIGTLMCSFDNGRRLGVIPGEDQFRKLTAKELEEEEQQNSSLTEKMNSAASRAGHSLSPERDGTERSGPEL